MLVERMRANVIQPFLTGRGPDFVLHIFTTDRPPDARGRPCIGYRLDQRDEGHPTLALFTGEDFYPSPLEEPFGDGAAMDLLHFLVDWEYKGECAHMRYFTEHYAVRMLLAAAQMLEPEPIVLSGDTEPIEA